MRAASAWAFLALIGLVLVICSFTGRLGVLMAVFLAPDLVQVNE